MNQKSSKNRIWVCFCVGHLLLPMGTGLKCGFCTHWDSIGETSFSFMIGYQLEMGSSLGINAYIHPSARTPYGLGLVKPCTFCLNLRKLMCFSLLWYFSVCVCGGVKFLNSLLIFHMSSRVALLFSCSCLYSLHYPSFTPSPDLILPF
jgi:hypothetical protein